MKKTPTPLHPPEAAEDSLDFSLPVAGVDPGDLEYSVSDAELLASDIELALEVDDAASERFKGALKEWIAMRKRFRRNLEITITAHLILLAMAFLSIEKKVKEKASPVIVNTQAVESTGGGGGGGGGGATMFRPKMPQQTPTQAVPRLQNYIADPTLDATAPVFEEGAGYYADAPEGGSGTGFGFGPGSGGGFGGGHGGGFGVGSGPPGPVGAQPFAALGLLEPKKTHDVIPDYPEAAKRVNLEGVVLLNAIVDESGNVADVQVVQGAPLGLTESAVAAVRKWKYQPSVHNGRPVAVRILVRVDYKLESQ